MSFTPVNPPPTEFAEWSDEQRAEDLRRFLDQAPDPEALWVFGIGSLIWDPRFEPADVRTGRLDGYRRAFCFWSVLGRGTFETPGLGLGLEPGGSCHGVVFRLPEQGLDEVLEALWLREMRGGVYRPTWAHIDSQGETIPAMCFVANPGHRNYAGCMPEDEAARVIASGRGPRGTSAEYLFLLEEALTHHGLEDDHVFDLARRVRAHHASQTASDTEGDDR